jgi:hypothetical protein
MNSRNARFEAGRAPPTAVYDFDSGEAEPASILLYDELSLDRILRGNDPSDPYDGFQMDEPHPPESDFLPMKCPERTLCFVCYHT